LSRYVPQRGEVALLDLNPQAGHEQAGRRPVLVLSRQNYNKKSGLALVCPLTTKVKGYPFEVPTTIRYRLGAVLADHVKSVDWIARKAERVGTLPDDIVDRVAAIVAALVEP
jgi:mRNA interferase MazF